MYDLRRAVTEVLELRTAVYFIILRFGYRCQGTISREHDLYLCLLYGARNPRKLLHSLGCEPKPETSSNLSIIYLYVR